MSTNNNIIDDNVKGDKNIYLNQSMRSSAMTPSIITTINNTNPNPPSNSTSIVNNGNANSKSKKPIEPYESYIEDSFVGHWEREDDDELEDPYKAGYQGADVDGGEENDSALHPSTIEFNFDSFGPESFIYTPVATTTNIGQPKQAGTNNIDDNNKLSSLKEEEFENTTIVDEAKVSEEKNISSSASSEINKLADGDKNVAILTSPQNDDTNIPPKQVRVVTTTNESPLDHLVDTTQIDLKVIEPYKKVISHAGYCHHLDPSAPAPKPGEPAPAIIVFSACYLPDRSRRDYNYVMDHLFLYVLSSLHELIADDYILIYLHNTQPSTTTGFLSSAKASLTSNNLVNGSTSSSATTSSTTTTTTTTNAEADVQHQNNLPTFTWIKRCYQMIDRKLRKNLKILYLVKPTFWLKTIVIMCKPFISAKFSKKLRFVESMEGLKKCLPVDKLILPASAENI